jgi:hypothetical protein
MSTRRALLGRVLERLWITHPTVTLTIQATPNACLRALAEATRPRLDRLELRNLYTDGRRYYLQPTDNGFELTSDSKVYWRRSRTAVASILDGTFRPGDDGSLVLHLRSRMRLLYFLDIFPVPAFVTSLLVFAPWSPGIIVLLAVTLFGLSIIWHRLTAALQAADMVYFVDKALEALAAPPPAPLPSGDADVIQPDAEFREVWRRYYEEQNPSKDG